MKKSNVFLATTLVAILGATGCGKGSTSSSNSSSSSSSFVSTSSSSSSSSSVFVSIHTEALTEGMFAGLKEGYSAEVVRNTTYEGSNPSYRIVDIDVDEKNYAFRNYSTDDGVTKKNLVTDSHYQINPEEENEMLYNAGLSIGNTVIYSPVMGRDPFTFDDIHLTWDEGYFSNVFANLSINDFTRVGTENKFALNVEDSALEFAGIFDMIDAQFFGETIEAGIEYFYLLTNGNEITGFELKYEGFISYESMVYRSAKGNFKAFGGDVVDFVKPLEGRSTDAELDEAIASLKEYNYKVVHSQSGYDYTSEKFVGRGKFEGEADGKSLNYYYYNNSNQKIMNYAYYDVVEEGQTYLQGATNINGTYYNDVLYYGSLSDILPSFNISSAMFVKSSESTDSVLVYELDKSVKISLDNDNSAYSSFDSDGYNDRTVYLTITIDKAAGTINFHNETSALADSGLIEDVLYSNIGEVEELITSENISDNCDGLSWTELLSNDESALTALITKIPGPVLEKLPTFGGRYAYVHYDAGAAAFFVDTYDKTENEELVTSYSQKLLDAGFTANEVEDDAQPSFWMVCVAGTRSYKVTLTLGTYWNSMQEWGQFQVFVTVGNA